MNGHPRARMKLISRLCENPVKIYNSRPFPALNYSLEWSNIAGQGSNIKNDGKSIVDQDSLSITSVAPLGCPFMPKQGPGPPPEPALVAPELALVSPEPAKY